MAPSAFCIEQRLHRFGVEGVGRDSVDSVSRDDNELTAADGHASHAESGQRFFRVEARIRRSHLAQFSHHRLERCRESPFSLKKVKVSYGGTETVFDGDCSDGFALPVAVFEDENSTRAQESRCRTDE